MKKSFGFFFDSSVITFILNVNVFAAEYRDTVRIGLNYGSDTVSSVQVSAEKGIDIGYYNNGTFSLLFGAEQQPASYNQKRRALYQNRNSCFGIFTNRRNSYAGKVIGPWHLKIGGEFADYNTARKFQKYLIERV